MPTFEYGGGFGRLTIGQGSEAGDGSAYSDYHWGEGEFGHGAVTWIEKNDDGDITSGFRLGSYFSSLDAGGRINMIRYDTPAIGPVGAAISVGIGDSISGQIKLSTEFSGTSFGAKVATLQKPGEQSTVGASFGSTLASGLTVSGAWAMGESTGANATDPSYFQAEIGYIFGNTGVAASWYNSSDFAERATRRALLLASASGTVSSRQEPRSTLPRRTTPSTTMLPKSTGTRRCSSSGPSSRSDWSRRLRSGTFLLRPSGGGTCPAGRRG